jgi:membrane protein DedA with SNARE-associated domain
MYFRALAESISGVYCLMIGLLLADYYGSDSTFNLSLFKTWLIVTIGIIIVTIINYFIVKDYAKQNTDF